MSKNDEIKQDFRIKRWQTISLKPMVFLKLSKIVNEINIAELEQNKRKSSISSIIDMALNLLDEKRQSPPPYFLNEL